jgi:hypothetical protein
MPFGFELAGKCFPHRFAASSQPHPCGWYNVEMQVTAPSSAGHQAQLPLGIGISYTKRHIDILRDLDENRFMHTGQFQRLYEVQRIFRDLKILTDHGLIEQPEAQWVWRRREGGGSNSRIHSLANPGKDLLRRQRFAPRKRDYADLNGKLSKAWFVLHLPHELAVVDAYISFRLGVAKRSDHSLAVAPTSAISIPGRAKSIFPDKLLIASRQGCMPIVLPIEVDRSTEPNERFARPDLSYLAEKFMAYHIYAYAGMPELEFGTPRFRVLIAVDGGDLKMRNVARTAFQISGGTAPERFLVTSLAALREGDPFEIEWMNAAEQMVRLAV